MRSDTTRHHQTKATQRAAPRYPSCVIFGSITLHDSSRLEIKLHDDALHCLHMVMAVLSWNQHVRSRSHAAMHDYSFNMITTRCSCIDELLSTSTWAIRTSWKCVPALRGEYTGGRQRAFAMVDHLAFLPGTFFPRLEIQLCIRVRQNRNGSFRNVTFPHRSI